MSFESLNELDKFIFDDCQISDVKLSGDSIVFSLEALIVEAGNSQNANYTDSYADTVVMELENARVVSAVIEGYRHYDADDRLVEEVPDTVLPTDNPAELLTRLNEGFLFRVQCLEKTPELFRYSFETEMDIVNDYGFKDPYCTTYQMEIEFAASKVSWDRFLNRVQK